MDVKLVEGNLLDQDTDVIVNAWNRNIIPWWLLLPQGLSRAIKRQAGLRPFKEVGWKGPIPLGGAVLTSAGRLPYQAIIHVAGINMLWVATRQSIHDSVKNGMRLAYEQGFKSIAFPVIGAGSGGRSELESLYFMLEAFRGLEYPIEVRIVRYGAVEKMTPEEVEDRWAKEYAYDICQEEGCSNPGSLYGDEQGKLGMLCNEHFEKRFMSMRREYIFRSVLLVALIMYVVQRWALR